MSFVCQSYVLACHSYVIRMSLVCTRMSFVCHSYVLIYYLYVLVCHSYVTGMYLYVIRMSLVCHPHATRIYSYAIRMSLLCHPYVTLMYSYAICMSLVCTLCHLYVTGKWFYHETSLLLHMDDCESFAQSEIVSFLFLLGSYFQNSMMLSRFSTIFFNSKPFDALSLKILFNFIYKRMN